ncbi:MAG TPA: c-type cytochrome [Paraburkholderia sp.]|jgi:cytochrome c553|nr:c-type cytochrome [Paraburkholderia sp.]
MELRVSSRRVFRPFVVRLVAPLGALLVIIGSASLPGAASAQTQPAPQSSAQPKAPDTMDARIQGCTACHGSHGQGTDNDYFPRLAGKPAGYLFNQLLNFREGRRKYPPMNYLVTYLSDDYLHDIAVFFSQQRPPYPVPATPTVSDTVLARGKALVQHGDAGKQVPACVQCHGNALTGMEPAIPGLVGLHQDYISAQLGAWRTGSRRAIEPDCMHMIATRLSDEDVNAVAAWLATQPAPQNPVPAPARSLKTPLACGSEPQ